MKKTILSAFLSLSLAPIFSQQYTVYVINGSGAVLYSHDDQYSFGKPIDTIPYGTRLIIAENAEYSIGPGNPVDVKDKNYHGYIASMDLSILPPPKFSQTDLISYVRGNFKKISSIPVNTVDLFEQGITIRPISGAIPGYTVSFPNVPHLNITSLLRQLSSLQHFTQYFSKEIPETIHTDSMDVWHIKELGEQNVFKGFGIMIMKKTEGSDSRQSTILELLYNRSTIDVSIIE